MGPLRANANNEIKRVAIIQRDIIEGNRRLSADAMQCVEVNREGFRINQDMDIDVSNVGLSVQTAKEALDAVLAILPTSPPDHIATVYINGKG